LEGIIKKNLELLHYAERLKQEIQQKDQLNSLLRNTFDGMSEGTIALDRQYHIRLISQKACQILDIREEEALNKSAALVLGVQVAGPNGLLVRVNTKEETNDLQTELLSPSGRVIPVSLTIKPLGKSYSNLEQLLFIRDLRAEQKLLRNRAGGIVFGEIISGSPEMKDIFNLIESVATSDAAVLIQGDSGTGKELVAKEIHTRSKRAKSRLHTVNCAAIPANLLESEFFGHEKGAFTGAYKTKVGRFELANKGTLFLDEIAEIPMELQVKLLRALQEQQFERVGGTETIQVDVRIIAATNRDLEQMVVQQRFREDLFYRLDVVKIALPPLQKRMSDLPLLVSHFIKQLNQRERRSVKDLSARAYQKLFDYHWPGNVRELYHAIEHAFAVSKGDILSKSHLPEKLLITATLEDELSLKPKSEKESIQLALEQSGFHKAKAAALLGISYVTLYRKIKKYNISS
jgi:transcriptional regulator with PAS, ATPase and Fis domain